MRPLSNLAFVPRHLPPSPQEVYQLSSFISSHAPLLLLTGAGVSTESGIPDYRSEGVGLYARSNHRPMKIQEFLSSPAAQRRYWARNYFGWPRFSRLEPNRCHQTISNWEQEYPQVISGLVTQNVDGLHQKAGSLGVIELHGTGHLVKCLECDYQINRALFQNVLQDMNSHLPVELAEEEDNPQDKIRPDGDVHLVESAIQSFNLAPCPKCGVGPLKPDIVFFGDNVPRHRVDKIYELLNASQGLLVLGSSLQTFSAYRYIMHAQQQNLPVAIVNLGPTRADPLATLKLKRRVGELLPLINLSTSPATS